MAANRRVAPAADAGVPIPNGRHAVEARPSSSSSSAGSSSSNPLQRFQRVISQIIESPASPTPSTEVAALVMSLRQGSFEQKSAAAEFLRLQCRESEEAREAVVKSGGLAVLASLAHTADVAVMESCITALYNLSLSKNLHRCVVEEQEILPAIINAMEKGSTETKTNAAGTVFNLCENERQREVIAQRGDLYEPLVSLLEGQDLRGQKDAALAMAHLSRVSCGRKSLVRAGAIPLLLELSRKPEMDAKAVAVLNNLVKSPDLQEDLVNDRVVSALAEVIECSDSARAREDAVSALLRLASQHESARVLVGNCGLLPGLNGICRSDQTSEKCRHNARSLVTLLRPRGADANHRLQQLHSMEDDPDFVAPSSSGRIR